MKKSKKDDRRARWIGLYVFSLQPEKKNVSGKNRSIIIIYIQKRTRGWMIGLKRTWFRGQGSVRGRYRDMGHISLKSVKNLKFTKHFIFYEIHYTTICHIYISP